MTSSVECHALRVTYVMRPIDSASSKDHRWDLNLHFFGSFIFDKLALPDRASVEALSCGHGAEILHPARNYFSRRRIPHPQPRPEAPGLAVEARQL